MTSKAYKWSPIISIDVVECRKRGMHLNWYIFGHQQIIGVAKEDMRFNVPDRFRQRFSLRFYEHSAYFSPGELGLNLWHLRPSRQRYKRRLNAPLILQKSCQTQGILARAGDCSLEMIKVLQEIDKFQY